VRCAECYEEIEDWEDTIGYDQLPHHKECLKEKYRTDNPALSDEEYQEFDQKVDEADQVVRDGNCLRFIKHDHKPCTGCDGSGSNGVEDPCLTCGGSGVV